MTNTDERRAKATQRVPMGTLVEICGNEPGIPAFEAESVDVSARGMHVRTAYLPELNAPLVCRFEDQGREIIVEGAVAWRREGARGGEFGIQFTALDASSVEALRDLCGVPNAGSDSAAPDESEAKNPAGSRVRLHIDGLGSPMKARVRGASDRGVQVGSNLEFLKVGRRLEVEDLERGAKREAFIDSVSVAIDPKTQVPQLVVALRYEEVEESTPEPSVIDSEAGRNAPLARTIALTFPAAAPRRPTPTTTSPRARPPKRSRRTSSPRRAARCAAAWRWLPPTPAPRCSEAEPCSRA